MLSAGYNFGRSKTRQNILLTGNYQVSGQNQGAISDPGVFGTTNNIKIPTRVVNGNLAHSITITKTKTTISTALNVNYNQLATTDNFYFGPNLSIGQAFLKNTLRVSLGSSYNQMLSNSVKTNEVFNHRLSFNYSPKFTNSKIGRMSINISATYLQKLKAISTAVAFNEFTGNAGINYSF